MRRNGSGSQGFLNDGPIRFVELVVGQEKTGLVVDAPAPVLFNDLSRRVTTNTTGTFVLNGGVSLLDLLHLLLRSAVAWPSPSRSSLLCLYRVQP